MSNYERFWSKILQRRQSPSSAYLTSALLTRLAREVGYQMQTPAGFSNSLQKRSVESSAARREKMRDADRDAELRTKWLAVEAEQRSILASDPRRVNPDSIILAQQRLNQARWFLDRLPDVRESPADSPTQK